MATILAISSQVARGHVGLSAIVPALQVLGHEVIALPTVLLSNHPGHPHAAGERVDPALLLRMLDALDANGWSPAIDIVLTGYLPSVAHVHVAVAAIERVQAHNAELLIACDPVLGDDPKGLYIEQTAAEAIRDVLLPRAHLLKPNRFELAWLSGREVTDAASAAAAARRLPDMTVVATSIPAPPGRLANCALRQGSLIASAASPHREGVPKGTGDLFAALVVGALGHGMDIAQAIERATAALASLIAFSAGRDELALPTVLPSLRAWMGLAP